MTKRRMQLGGAVGVIVLVAAFLAWRHFSVRISTDDAQIDGHVNAVAARVGGTVAAVLVADNQYVEKGAVLVRIEAKDYEIAVARGCPYAYTRNETTIGVANPPMMSSILARWPSVMACASG